MVSERLLPASCDPGLDPVEEQQNLAARWSAENGGRTLGLDVTHTASGTHPKAVETQLASVSNATTELLAA